MNKTTTRNTKRITNNPVNTPKTDGSSALAVTPVVASAIAAPTTTISRTTPTSPPMPIIPNVRLTPRTASESNELVKGAEIVPATESEAPVMATQDVGSVTAQHDTQPAAQSIPEATQQPLVFDADWEKAQEVHNYARDNAEKFFTNPQVMLEFLGEREENAMQYF